jgi:regulation of enolase protein 1 (concanavalin A-like superfamily)
VVTNPYSDWAMQACPVDGPLTIRLTSEPGQLAKLQLSYFNGTQFIPYREIMGWQFDKNQNVDVGIFACSPGDNGFRVDFWNIVAQDYSELAFEQRSVGQSFHTTVNPNLMSMHGEQ